MKKFLSAVLALVMVFSLTTVAFAADNEDAAAGPSVTGSVAPVITEVTLVVNGEEITMTEEQLTVAILVTSHEEGEAAMNKLKEELEEKGLTEEEMMSYECENGLTYAENLALVDLYNVAAASETTSDYIEAHGEGVLEAAMETLEMTKEEINNYKVAMISDIRVMVEALAEALNVDVSDVTSLTVKFSTPYVNADSKVFLQQDIVDFEEYANLVTDSENVNIEKENVVFYPATAGEDDNGGFVVASIDPNKNGPITLFVNQPEAEAAK